MPPSARALKNAWRLRKGWPRAPVEEALSLHAGTVVIEADELAYRAAFQRVLTALQGVSDRVEETELGTAYVDLDGLQEMYGGEAGWWSAPASARRCAAGAASCLLRVADDHSFTLGLRRRCDAARIRTTVLPCSLCSSCRCGPGSRRNPCRYCRKTSGPSR